MINIKYSFSTVIAVSFILFFTACEDVVEITLDEAPQLLVVDAWLNNKSEEQVIKLTLSQPYFDSQLAEGIDQASIVVSNKNGSELAFANQGDGRYTWIPAPGETIGQIGDEFSLSIDWNGELYAATSAMNPAPKIDSVTYEFRTDELIGPDGIYAQFFARDIIGRGNTYWIKAFKNGQFLNKPAELNIAFDAGFDGGADTDGRVFIPPIRELINRVPDEDNPDDDIDVPPYAEGDSIYVEIHSITNEAFDFMEIARDQMRNGENTIFAIPIANTRGNVVNTATGEIAIGMFCVSAVEGLGTRVE